MEIFSILTVMLNYYIILSKSIELYTQKGLFFIKYKLCLNKPQKRDFSCQGSYHCILQLHYYFFPRCSAYSETPHRARIK